MSEIVQNNLYAPGISTYGIKGDKGKRGAAGYGIYYVPFDDINNSIVSDYIKNNMFISNNNINQLMNDRLYQVKDLFVIPNGKLYELEEMPTDTSIAKFKYLTSFANPTEIYDVSNNTVYFKNSKKIVFADDASLSNNESFINIISKNNKIFEYNNYDSSFSFSYDNSVYNVTSNANLLLNCPLYAKSNITTNAPTNFSSLLIQDNKKLSDYIDISTGNEITIKKKDDTIGCILYNNGGITVIDDASGITIENIDEDDAFFQIISKDYKCKYFKYTDYINNDTENDQ